MSTFQKAAASGRVAPRRRVNLRLRRLEPFSVKLNGEGSKFLIYRVSDPRIESGEQKRYPLLLETP